MNRREKMRREVRNMGSVVGTIPCSERDGGKAGSTPADSTQSCNWRREGRGMIAEDLLCQFEWPSDGPWDHECRLLEGHEGPHKCAFADCDATHENESEVRE